MRVKEIGLWKEERERRESRGVGNMEGKSREEIGEG